MTFPVGDSQIPHDIFLQIEGESAPKSYFNGRWIQIKAGHTGGISKNDMQSSNLAPDKKLRDAWDGIKGSAEVGSVFGCEPGARERKAKSCEEKDTHIKTQIGLETVDKIKTRSQELDNQQNKKDREEIQRLLSEISVMLRNMEATEKTVP